MANPSAIVSQAPVVSRFAAQAMGTKSVGDENPIELPYISINVLGPTLGEKIGEGGLSTIYAVQDKPGRVYKIIFLNKFTNGDEIRISEIAARTGVASAFHGACVVRQQKSEFVAIEMDYAGKTLGRWSEEFAEEAEKLKPKDPEPELTPDEIAVREEVTKLMAESGMRIISRRSVEQLSLEETMEKLGDTAENFYFELFSNIKRLAEERIAYTDANWGNIIPRSTLTGRMQLIDFGQAQLCPNPVTAAVLAANALYNVSNLREYSELNDLSPESQQLIRWYADRLTPGNRGVLQLQNVFAQFHISDEL